MTEETKVEKYLKYYNIFSYLILNYIFRKNVSLIAIYREAGDKGESASWYDVIDGICWICSVIGAIIGNGYLLEALK
jgi:hypothetical protein